MQPCWGEGGAPSLSLTPPYSPGGSGLDKRKEAFEKRVFGDVVFFCLLICCQGQFCERCELMRDGEKQQENRLGAKKEPAKQEKELKLP